MSGQVGVWVKVLCKLVHPELHGPAARKYPIAFSGAGWGPTCPQGARWVTPDLHQGQQGWNRPEVCTGPFLLCL